MTLVEIVELELVDRGEEDNGIEDMTPGEECEWDGCITVNGRLGLEESTTPTRDDEINSVEEGKGLDPTIAQR